MALITECGDVPGIDPAAQFAAEVIDATHSAVPYNRRALIVWQKK
jgi:hypothetical protein